MKAELTGVAAGKRGIAVDTAVKVSALAAGDTFKRTGTAVDGVFIKSDQGTDAPICTRLTDGTYALVPADETVEKMDLKAVPA